MPSPGAVTRPMCASGWRRNPQTRSGGHERDHVVVNDGSRAELMRAVDRLWAALVTDVVDTDDDDPGP